MVSRQIKFVRREFKRTAKEQLASQTIYEDDLDPFEGFHELLTAFHILNTNSLILVQFFFRTESIVGTRGDT